MIGTFHNATTGGTVARALTDTEILQSFAPQVLLSADKTTVTANGVDFVTIRVQLQSLPLSDGLPRNLSLAQKVLLQIGETIIELDTDANGYTEHELDFEDAGSFDISVQLLNGNTLTIQAV